MYVASSAEYSPRPNFFKEIWRLCSSLERHLGCIEAKSISAIGTTSKLEWPPPRINGKIPENLYHSKKAPYF